MSQKRTLESSIKIETTDDYFTCKYCTFSTANIDELDEHIQIHEDSIKIAEEEEKVKKIEADVEDQTTKIKFEIEEYEESKKYKSKKRKVSQDLNDDHKDVWFKCGMCPYKTKRKHDLPKHFLTHCTLDETTIYRCSVCDYETKRKTDMPKHMLGHCTIGVPMYKCPHCPYQTKRKNDLPKHLLCHQPHETLTLWYCAHCSYCTKRKGDLQKHEMNHLTKDQLQFHRCSECSYATKRKNDLYKHILVHCDRHLEGYFKCLKCPYATDKVHKFSKHVLSGCSFWQGCKNLDHSNLEEMLENADREGTHVIFNNEDQPCYIELDEFQEGEEYELVEETDNIFTENVDSQSQITYEHHYGNQENQSEYYENEDNYQVEVEHNSKKAIFNLNLGEFTVDEDAVSQSVQYQKAKGHR